MLPAPSSAFYFPFAIPARLVFRTAVESADFFIIPTIAIAIVIHDTRSVKRASFHAVIHVEDDYEKVVGVYRLCADRAGVFVLLVFLKLFGGQNGNVSVKKDGKKYKLITRLLPTSQKNKLHKMYRVCSIANTYPKNIPLQINLIVQDGEWIEAHICGLGKPRSGAISIEKALQLSIPKERRVLQQGSLLDI